MRYLLYSQHVLGIGHFFRTMAIAGALAPSQVLLVEGGGTFEGFEPPPHVRRVALPPLLMDPDFKTVYSPEDRNPEELKSVRVRALLEAYREFDPDVVITELFPFGRKQFQFELMPLLEAVHSAPHPVTTVCSLRDILVEKKDPAAYESRVLKLLNTHYHLLLVHSDPRLVTLDATFGAVSDIAVPVRYTGFVLRPPVPRPAERPPGRVVVASSGGGRVGTDLLLATVRAMAFVPLEDVRLRVFLGPFMEDSDREAILASAANDPRIAALPFATDFPAELAAADLSISMAGYNTCMDILGSGIPALVYPFSQNREQGVRARTLERLGIVGIIEDLDTKNLAGQITRALVAPARGDALSPPLDLDGAERTRTILEEVHFTRQRG